MIEEEMKQIKNVCQQEFAYYKAKLLNITYIENKTFSAQFEQSKQKLISAGIKFETKIMYHGTPQQNVDSILLNNFDLSRAWAARRPRGK
jgi:hypothetical protein